MDLSRRAYAIFSSHGDDGVRTYLLNALPDLFTALAHRGMPLHNNGIRQEIRDGTIPQRNARHKLMTAEGRAVSVLRCERFFKL